MSKWAITYSKDNNTEKLEVEAADKPSLDDAVQRVLTYADQNCESKEPADESLDLSEPAVQLAECYGIAVTGISRL
ncbi:hypothetical protein [Pseudomonas matsuisoli]|uniref:Uncharacterized protein n=1 Tax=Pseudomonas matsuisoli TaxID=1515666 RepID=A0A917URL5_9PSED|nr:hypothetical protein [Pseudomonas matsuisoli]GGJ79505.1 hypothetical protein GCM10009304_01690 [Pseudomonas matsuisoli]